MIAIGSKTNISDYIHTCTRSIHLCKRDHVKIIKQNHTLIYVLKLK